MFELFSIAFPLFLLMDPVGNVPLFISILKNVDASRQKKVILREMLIALGVIILFNFVGEFLLAFLHIEQSTLLISGGIILFIISIKLIFPESSPSPEPDAIGMEPFVVPLAIPLVAGPAVLAAVMLYSYKQTNPWISIGAILLAWGASTPILMASVYLKEKLGTRGLIACERLMGLLLVLISTQMFLGGIRLFLSGE